MLSCQRCKQTSNGPQSFLLTCRGCSKTWHHRCHTPPIADEELIRRIRATNAGDTANGLSLWTCRRCKKGVSEIPSTMSGREPTASSDSREDRKNLTSSYSPAVTDITTSTSTSTPTAGVASTVNVRVKQESSSAVDARLLNDRERDQKSDRQESIEAAPVKRILSAKGTKPSATNRPHAQPQPGPTQPRDADMQMADTTPAKFTPQEKKRPPQRSSSTTHSLQGKSARKFVSTVPATSSEDDIEMRVEVTPPGFSKPTSRATSQASQASSSDNQAIRPMSVAEAPPRVRATSSNEQEREVRPADGAAIQPRADQDVANEIDDDPEDLYGPPVERRIIRILPSLAEELKEQQRRVAAEKEKRQAPLAPDWIYAKHVHDPLWKEIPTEGRKRRKPAARKLGDNGLNVNELMGCFTVQNWVREHKT